MKWTRMLLPVLLILGMLLGVGVAYADEPPDEGGLTVDIVVVGNNADVGLDLYGDDNTADITFHSENPTILINGQDINEPTVIHKDDGVSGGWVNRRISQAVGPLYSWFGDVQGMVALTADGLAKVIMTIGDQDSQLDNTSADIVGLNEGLGAQSAQLESHEDRLAGLDEHVKVLEVQDASTQAFVRDYANYLQTEFDRKLVLMSLIFAVVVIGLAVGFGVSIHRLNKRRL